MDDIYQDFWSVFCEEAGVPEAYCSRYTYFGNSEEESVTAIEQLLSGEKTTISHCIPHYIVTRAAMPKIGDYTMVTDFYGNPALILETADVSITPLPETPQELIDGECQGDRDAWLHRKQQEFQEKARRGGFHWNEELPVLMETVRVVYPTGGKS